MSYNGYENWATWNTMLNLTNDQGLYEAAVGVLRDFAPQDRPTVLCTFVEEELIPDVEGLAGSFIGHALAQINWHEVVGYFAEDLLPDCDDCGERMTKEDEDERDGLCATCREKAEEDEEEHTHEWGPVAFAFMTGNPHRRCACGMVSLDLDDEEEDDETGE